MVKAKQPAMQKKICAAFALGLSLASPLSAQPAATAATASTATSCANGAYGTIGGDFVVLVRPADSAAAGLRYMFRDGRRGSTAAADTPVSCVNGAALVGMQKWSRIAFRETPLDFQSVGTAMHGSLIEPDNPVADRPLVVMVHGSERSSPIGGIYGYAMAAQGISVFVYDKRGTGASGGEYTQNFDLLGEDAANALRAARQSADGRYSRAGFFGGSQGGWVAPRAATITPADFVAIGFGLVASPIDEDREQMISEVRALDLGTDVEAAAEARVNALSAATAQLLLSGFADGYGALDTARGALYAQSWGRRIAGEYSGAIAAMSDEDLRRIGRARFDNVELIWNYDAMAVLRRLDTPLLWVLAGDDREAPIETTRTQLLALQQGGRPVDIFLFPGTDHGMWEYVTLPDGSRDGTRITDGYLRLLGDWSHGRAQGAYGRGESLTGR